VAHLRRVGFKFDRWLDVIYLELLLERPVPASPETRPGV
jgi:L-amino acid N-acyltransferase YncA